MIESMFHLHLPVLEKMVRPMIVYLFLVTFLRIFGKRELAQLNPFDLVVLLSLSNTVQNAMIGDDNTITGGLIGAFSLLTINWLMSRLLYNAPKVNAALEGPATVLIHDGVIDRTALQKEALTETELLSVLHKQGFADFSEVDRCVLEPAGTFYIEAVKPTPDQNQMAALRDAIHSLSAEVKGMRGELKALRTSGSVAES
jgi:uncharacterized membrane protein YcaP (DUF421 family)